ncbi:MAG: hypothetical protein WDA72_00040 [Desulfomonilia bacterium]|jgi:hypothetical protein|nr:hypothetical protein [Deltaproteobacteria bacterium]MDX9761040.1 hypothetical protein [Desulfomonilia bacterium]HPW68216.1 hypothetical protein [Deltaproteobacteria bacterium]
MSVQALTGWLTALALAAAFSTYLLKQIGREYVKRLPREYADFADAYRSFMKLMVGRHRIFGAAALIALAAHAYPVIAGSFISVSGLIAAFVLICASAAGAWLFYGKKSLRTGLLSVHRALAFVLLPALIIHFFFTGMIAF